MKWMYLTLLVIAVISGTAFGTSVDSNMLLVANDNYNAPYIAVQRILYPQYTNMGAYLPGGDYPTLPFGSVDIFNTAGLASESPLCDQGRFYTSYVCDTGAHLYIVGHSEITGIPEYLAGFGTVSGLVHTSGLATRYLVDGSIPALNDPFFYSGGFVGNTGGVVALDSAGTGCIGEGMYGCWNPINSSTDKVVGLTFNPSYTTLYALTRMDSGQYQVFQASNLTDTLTFTTWSGLFSIPSGATTVYDCGMVGDQIVFGVNNTSTYPLWSIGQGGTSATAVSSVIWKEIGGWISGGWREPRGLDFVYFPPWVPVTAPRETGFNTSIAPEISVSENPFSASTVITAEALGMISVYDLGGRLISEGNFDDSYTFEPRESGVYFVQITDGVSISTARLVKL